MNRQKSYLWGRILTVLLVLTALCMTGCKKKEKQVPIFEEITNTPAASTATPQPTATTVPEPTLTPEETHEGQAKSRLSGLWIDKEAANQRPYAVMLNNIVYANPQSGISDATILYEALVEGGITRLMGIFENIDPESEAAKRIGSVRSARHYYVSFADEYDAIFVHYGQTTYATKKIKALGIDTISGMAGPGVSAFYRDKSIKAPHNAFASLKGLTDSVTKGKYRSTYEEGSEGHFSFYEEDTVLTSDQNVTKLKLKFSGQITPVLTYDESKGEYLREQFNGPHIDYNTKEQLSFKNVIVQFVKEWDIDKNGYQTMDLADASGKGYYISNGKLVDITWKKNESTKKMRYYDTNGDELTMNPGKTYIAVFPNNRVKDVVLN